MKADELTDRGVYILTRDVTNPSPDRRMRDVFPAMPIWPAGLMVRVRGSQTMPHLGKRIRAAGKWGDVAPYDAGFDALVDALALAPRTFETVMLSFHGSKG